MKKFILLICFIIVGCGANVYESNDSNSDPLVCEQAVHADQYTVYYEKISGDCGNLNPLPAYEPLLNVADCQIVADKYLDNNCTWSFVLVCEEDEQYHTSFFSSTMQAYGTMIGWAKFSGTLCDGEYKTVLVPYGDKNE